MSKTYIWIVIDEGIENVAICAKEEEAIDYMLDEVNDSQEVTFTVEKWILGGKLLISTKYYDAALEEMRVK